MLIGIVANVGVLVWLKYLPFLIENINAVASAYFKVNPFPTISSMISIGVSFYVFQGIAYLVDIYLETGDPEIHFGRFALSMSFFPKLLQGPIERGGLLHPQLQILVRPKWGNVHVGMNLFLFGMFKKVVVADRLATFVDPVYSNVHAFHGIPLVVATYLFALQIYFDFSGYTDMALGIARCFNIQLTQNFNNPYSATSTAEFWRRWHISFSSWILDYIFKPLQMQFRTWPKWGTPLALLITFLISGLWHGANWCFIIWGGLHGLYLSCGVLWKKRQRTIYRRMGIEKHRLLSLWQWAVTFNLVSFAWIFFRANHFNDAIYIARSSILDFPLSLVSLVTSSGSWEQVLFLGKTSGEVIWLGVAILIAVVLSAGGRWIHLSQNLDDAVQWITRLPWWSKGVVYGIYVYLIAICGTASQGFIYQQF
jgi:D-alanyl-lipoteichoic acid acyltransferase DltB (MBOAT superfamily)